MLVFLRMKARQIAPDGWIVTVESSGSCSLADDFPFVG